MTKAPNFLLDPQFILEAENEVPSPAGGRDDPVGQSFLQFGRSGACILRDREVVAQSAGTGDRHRAGHLDQPPCLCIQDFLVLEIDLYLFPRRHFFSFSKMPGERSAPLRAAGLCYLRPFIKKPALEVDGRKAAL